MVQSTAVHYITIKTACLTCENYAQHADEACPARTSSDLSVKAAPSRSAATVGTSVSLLATASVKPLKLRRPLRFDPSCHALGPDLAVSERERRETSGPLGEVGTQEKGTLRTTVHEIEPIVFYKWYGVKAGAERSAEQLEGPGLSTPIVIRQR